MTSEPKQDIEQGIAPKAAAFICYSRKDIDFADRLVAALTARGFAAFIDHHDIEGGEKWEPRLKTLITQADALVFVMSPDAAASPHCKDEIDFAQTMGKRLIPILWRPLDDKLVREDIRSLERIDMHDEARFEQRIQKLAERISTDIAWVRQHTEFGAEARRWATADKPGAEGLLLRPPRLDTAERWLRVRPREGPELTEQIREFITMSREAFTEEEINTLVRCADDQRLRGNIETALRLCVLAVRRGFANRQTQEPARASAALAAAVCASDLRLTLCGHSQGLDWAAFSPDGRRIVTASDDRTARIWDAATGIETAVLRHADSVHCAAVSPDGASIVTAGTKTASIWDLGSARVTRSLDGHSNNVWTAAFSPDGTRILTASWDKTARIWNSATGEAVTELAHGNWLQSAAFSPDGRGVVTACWDKRAYVWNAATGKVRAVLSGHHGQVFSAAFSPDGKCIATAAGTDSDTDRKDDTVRIWDAADGRPIAVWPGHTDQVYSVAFSRHGSRIASAAKDATARIWNSKSGTTIAILRGHAGSVMSAAFSPDGDWIVTASADRTARVWNAPASAVLPEHAGEVFAAAFSPDGSRVVTAARDNLREFPLRTWNATNGRELVSDPANDAWLAESGGNIAGSPSCRITGAVVEIREADGRRRALLRGHGATVQSCRFSPDRRRIVTAASDNTARIWDAATGEELMLLAGHEDRVLSAAFSPDGRRVVTASRDRTARIWDVPFATMSTHELIDEVCGRRLRGITTLTRDEMRLAGYPDDMPEIDVATRA